MSNTDDRELFDQQELARRNEDAVDYARRYNRRAGVDTSDPDEFVTVPGNKEIKGYAHSHCKEIKEKYYMLLAAAEKVRDTAAVHQVGLPSEESLEALYALLRDDMADYRKAMHRGYPESVRTASERLDIPIKNNGLPMDIVHPAPFPDDYE